MVTRLIGSDEALRDRAALDSIACTLGESQEWDSEYVEMVADAVGRTGRPHPGTPALSDKELGAAEDAGEDPDEAYAQAYRKKLDSAHAAAAVTKLDRSELGTEGLDAEINATWEQVWAAKERVQALTTRSMARQLITAMPDAAYLDLEQDNENRGHMRPLSVYSADGEVLIEDTTYWASEGPDRPDLEYLASQLDDDSGSWNQFCVDPDQGQHPWSQTFRVDLRAATKAGE